MIRFIKPLPRATVPPEEIDEIATDRHTYVIEEDSGEVSVAKTTDRKIATLVAGESKAVAKGAEPKPVPVSLKETQAILRRVILDRTGGITGIVDTLEDARLNAVNDGSMLPDHRARMKAAELELRLMGLMGTEAAAAVEETKNETAAVIATDITALPVAERRAHFLKQVRAKQLGIPVEEVDMDIKPEILEKLSPASAGKEYTPVPLPTRILGTSGLSNPDAPSEPVRGLQEPVELRSSSAEELEHDA